MEKKGVISNIEYEKIRKKEEKQKTKELKEYAKYSLIPYASNLEQTEQIIKTLFAGEFPSEKMKKQLTSFVKKEMKKKFKKK